MGEIWVLGHGSYSDYGVVAAFTTKELAEAVEATDEEFSVQAIPLLSEAPAKTITSWHVYAYVIDSKPPRIEGPFTRTAEHWSWNGPPAFGPERPVTSFDWYGPSQYSYPPQPGRWSIRAECRDREQALKSVQDRIAELMARLAGVTDGPLPGRDEDGSTA
jgi:hypothetical protein